MSGQVIDIAAAGGAAPRAYLALPEAGSGPGLVLLTEAPDAREVAELYAAEGYVVLCSEAPDAEVAALVGALRGRDECTGKIAALGFASGGRLAYLAAAAGIVDCAVSYCGAGIADELALAPRIGCPLAMHFAERDPRTPPEAVARVRKAFAGRPAIAVHIYPGAAPGFERKTAADYDLAAAGLALSRSIAVLRRTIGPHYDLEALWEAHTHYEFGTRDVAATMRTMVAEPYVNHIPVMTGGVGQRELTRFYAHHFIPKCPADIKLTAISRTIGADRLVDEMVVSFTHDVEIDWMLPGIAPTGRHVEVPVVAIVGFRGGKLWHEHIYWDQASVLVQIGLIDPAGLPVAGIESARKLRDETLPSNTLMKRWAESAAPPG